MLQRCRRWGVGCLLVALAAGCGRSEKTGSVFERSSGGTPSAALPEPEALKAELDGEALQSRVAPEQRLVPGPPPRGLAAARLDARNGRARVVEDPEPGLVLPTQPFEEPCYAVGEQVYEDTYSEEPGRLTFVAETISEHEANFYPPLGIHLSPDEKTLYVSDPGELIELAMGTDGFTMRGSAPVPGSPRADAVTPLPGGRIASFSSRGALVRLHDAQGRILWEKSGAMVDSDNAASFRPVLIPQADGVWLSNLNELARVMTADYGFVQEAALEGAAFDEAGTVRIRSSVTYPKTLTVDVGPRGEDPARRVKVDFGLDVLGWTPPRVAVNGDIYLFTTHPNMEGEWRYEGESDLLTVLSKDLAVTQRRWLPPRKQASLPLPVALGRDGTLYLLTLVQHGGQITRYRPGPSGLVPCGQPPPRGEEPAIDWNLVADSRMAGDLGFGCRAQVAAGWLRFHCPEQSPFPGAPRGLGLAREPRIIKKESQGGVLNWSGQGLEKSRPVDKSQSFAEILVPFAPGSALRGSVGWDKAYRSLEFEWPLGEPSPQVVGRFLQAIPFPEVCDHFKRTQTQLLEASGLAAPQRALFPSQLGTCVAGGPGAWVTVVGVRQVGSANGLYLDLEVQVHSLGAGGEPNSLAPSHLDADYNRPLKMQHGTADFNGDKQDDYYVIIESAPGGGTSEVWTIDETLARLDLSPLGFFHGVVDEDSDALADVISYGPFFMALGKGCGLKTCPEFVSGPPLLGHNTGKGFSFSDAVAQKFRQKQCAQAPAEPFAKLAQRVVCGRLAEQAPQALLALIDASSEVLCAQPKRCQALGTLKRWATEPLPKDW